MFAQTSCESQTAGASTDDNDVVNMDFLTHDPVCMTVSKTSIASKIRVQML